MDIPIPLLSYLQKNFVASFSLGEADVSKTILDADRQSRVPSEGVPVFERKRPIPTASSWF
ncbi:MAG TPA: hypothetical protein DHV39_03455 [Verrucomicrobiales bacterium]|nr:hypothetical protein [Verrucomicrobiales bacterium]HCZ02456.1 hypothetical protein [Verrucomicrobiales bacterium]